MEKVITPERPGSGGIAIVDCRARAYGLLRIANRSPATGRWTSEVGNGSPRMVLPGNGRLFTDRITQGGIRSATHGLIFRKNSPLNRMLVTENNARIWRPVILPCGHIAVTRLITPEFGKDQCRRN